MNAEQFKPAPLKSSTPIKAAVVDTPIYTHAMSRAGTLPPVDAVCLMTGVHGDTSSHCVPLRWNENDEVVVFSHELTAGKIAAVKVQHVESGVISLVSTAFIKPLNSTVDVELEAAKKKQRAKVTDIILLANDAGEAADWLQESGNLKDIEL